jgi:hypothetical protein
MKNLRPKIKTWKPGKTGQVYGEGKTPDPTQFAQPGHVTMTRTEICHFMTVSSPDGKYRLWAKPLQN